LRPRDRVAVALALALVTVPLFPAQPASAQSLYCERKVTFRTIGFGWFHRLLPEVTTRCTGAVAISMSWPGPVAPGGLSTARARLTVRWAGEFVQPLVGRFVRFLLSVKHDAPRLVLRYASEKLSPTERRRVLA